MGYFGPPRHDDTLFIDTAGSISTPSVSPTPNADLPIIEGQNQTEQSSYNSTLILLIIVSVLVVINISAYIHSKYIHVNDYFKIGSLVTAGILIMDAVSDIFFAMAISEDIILLILAVVFIVLPVVITLYQLHQAINKWRRNDELNQWISDNVKILYISSIITGSSFAGVALCTSNAFSLYQTSLPLNKTRLLQFDTKRIYSTVLLENIPQLGLQIYLLINGESANDFVLYVSMTFSILSIVVSILSMISQRSIARSRDYVSIEFDAKGSNIISNMSQCHNRKHGLQTQMASLLGIQRNLIEVIRPRQVQQGLHVTINLYINNARAIDMNIEKEINKYKSSGQLANIMKESWNLSSPPMIENVKYTKHESKERRDGTELIQIQSASMHNINAAQGHSQQKSDAAISGLNNNNDNALPPHIPPPIKATGGGNDDSDSQESEKAQTEGNTLQNESLDEMERDTEQRDYKTNKINVTPNGVFLNPHEDQEILGIDVVTEGIDANINQDNEEDEDGSYHSSHSDLAYEHYAMAKRTSCFIPDPDKDKFNNTTQQ